jgi:hypothetical protein
MTRVNDSLVNSDFVNFVFGRYRAQAYSRVIDLYQ